MIIFLDHRGVMLDFKQKDLKFNQNDINTLNHLLEPNIDIVVSSDWIQFMTFSQIIKMYESYGIKKPIGYSFKPNHVIKNKCELRASTILDWIKSYNNQNEIKLTLNDWIAIDDLDLRPYLPIDNFIWIQDGIGLFEYHKCNKDNFNKLKH